MGERSQDRHFMDVPPSWAVCVHPVLSCLVLSRVWEPTGGQDSPVSRPGLEGLMVDCKVGFERRVYINIYRARHSEVGPR